MDTPESDLVEALREDLTAAGFTVAGVTDRLGPMAAEALHRESVIPADRATRGARDPLGLLIRLFVLAQPVATTEADRALPRLGVSGLVELGLAAAVGDQVSSLAEVRPYGDSAREWWLASDHGEAVRPGPLPLDHVLGVGGASLTLASWTPRTAVASALDIGTGCGVQALHLAGHAGRVVATDISARALWFARLNAELAQVDLDLRRGDLLDPVAGERFDLVVANPPFVITPRAAAIPRYEYRDGGRAGDAVVEQLVRGVGGHLAPGGVAQLLGNWEVVRGAPWTERIAAWVRASGLDGWVVQREVQDVAEYAELWARDGGHRPGTPEHAALVEAWLDDFAARDVEAIGFGVVTLQQPAGGAWGTGGEGVAWGTGGAAGVGDTRGGGAAGVGRAPWVHLEEVVEATATPMGPTVVATLHARSTLATAAAAGRVDSVLLDTAWVVAPDVTDERHYRPGQADPAVIVLRQGGGLRRTRQVGAEVAALVGVCDGDLTARQALAAIAELLDASPAETIAAVLPVLSDLVAEGFLTA